MWVPRSHAVARRDGLRRTCAVKRGQSAWGSYARIADTLRQRITASTYPPGTLLPSEARLGEEFGVVRNTVRRALAILAAEGLIETSPGRGRVVRSAAEPTTLYRRIAADLAAAIAAGTLPAGDPLPSEADLVRRYRASRGTVRTALAELEAHGLIETRQGRHRRVRSVPPSR